MLDATTTTTLLVDMLGVNIDNTLPETMQYFSRHVRLI